MLDPGTIVYERYRIERLVGQGAMGAVYAAIDLRLGHTVALKHTLIPGPQGAAALDREGQILARLRHPGLPTVSDTFVAAEGQCIVMAFVPGPTLADLLDERGAGFPAALVLGWADQILVALEYLHGQRPPVIHRDIKPQNLKLTPEGQVILLDFGLARGALFQTQLAGRRSVVGYTLPYAPIEQVRGLDTDPRSDLFALAGTLYHLLIGAPPPDALERAAALLAGGSDPLEPPALRRPEVPEGLSATLVQTLALDSDGRPASAAALRAALARAYDHAEPAPAPSADQARRRGHRTHAERPLRGWMVAAALALVATGLAVLIGGPALLRTSQPITIEWASAARTPSEPGETGWVAPDSAISAVDATNTAIASRGLRLPTTNTPTIPPYPASDYIVGAQRYAVAIPSVDWGANLAYSPDGEKLYVSSRQGVMAIDAQAGAIRTKLADSQSIIGGLALSPDGQTLAFGSFKGLQLLQIADGQPSTLFPNSAQALWVDFTHDGRRLAYNDKRGIVHVIDLLDDPGGRWGTLAPKGVPPQIRDLTFAPDGATLAIAQGDVSLRRASDGWLIHIITLDNIYIETTPVPSSTSNYGAILAMGYNDGLSDQTVPANALAFSPDGTTLAIGYENGTINLVRTDTWEIKANLPINQTVSDLAFAPDGQSLAAGYADGAVRVWIFSTPPTFTSFTVGADPVLSVAFAPDGHSLAAINNQLLRVWRVP